MQVKLSKDEIDALCREYKLDKAVLKKWIELGNKRNRFSPECSIAGEIEWHYETKTHAQDGMLEWIRQAEEGTK